MKLHLTIGMIVALFVVYLVGAKYPALGTKTLGLVGLS